MLLESNHYLCVLACFLRLCPRYRVHFHLWLWFVDIGMVTVSLLGLRTCLEWKLLTKRDQLKKIDFIDFFQSKFFFTSSSAHMSFKNVCVCHLLLEPGPAIRALTKCLLEISSYYTLDDWFLFWFTLDSWSPSCWIFLGARWHLCRKCPWHYSTASWMGNFVSALPFSLHTRERARAHARTQIYILKTWDNKRISWKVYTFYFMINNIFLCNSDLLHLDEDFIFVCGFI